MKKINDGLSTSERYAKRHRELGLCTNCPNQAVEGNKRCQTCLDKLKDNYNARKGKKDAETVNKQCEQDISGLPLQG